MSKYLSHTEQISVLGLIETKDRHECVHELKDGLRSVRSGRGRWSWSWSRSCTGWSSAGTEDPVIDPEAVVIVGEGSVGGTETVGRNESMQKSVED